MFSEYRELIARLEAEGTNHRFLRLHDRHAELDRRIAEMEAQDAGDTHAEIAELKKEKLRVKDEIFALLRDEQGAAGGR